MKKGAHLNFAMGAFLHRYATGARVAIMRPCMIFLKGSFRPQSNLSLRLLVYDLFAQ